MTDISREDAIQRVLADPPYGNTGRVVMGAAQVKATTSAIIAAIDAAEGRVTVKQKDDSHSDSKVLE